MPINIDRVTKLTEELSQNTQLLAEGNEKSRLKLLLISYKLTQALENPQETFWKLWMLDSITRIVVQVASDLKLPEYLPDEPDKAVGSAELAEKTGAEQALLTRLLNHLAASGFVEEAGPDLFYANILMRHLSTKAIQDGSEFYPRTMGKAVSVLPQYLAEHGYRDPTDELDCPWQKAFDTKLHSFEYIQKDPDLARLFKHAVLSQNQVRRTHWEDHDFYPVQERLLSGLKPNSVLMVDVGGGIGLDLTIFHDSHPLPVGARLILQDVDSVLKTTGDLTPSIEKIPHDFFQEQPPSSKGARAYFFHRVFHDWSDDKCREILLALKPAMVPVYSKVLLLETVVPSQGATWLNTAADLVMMCGLAGRERTETGFKDLLESVGMEITGIYTRSPGEESIIEAIVPE
ncbi:hypothetical protein N0V93_001567 [Gnomoniopsis smithogilvyi]|uniref:O-methyltransferase n=1 Tax=Gnomoniopsis smithogilvyi TaxID=1191159 RepID=A0A9W8Z1W1_9PEZI|nr:hypothetical protein N0V93_001567 [Gnomoniopsis smithogilvyi]